MSLYANTHNKYCTSRLDGINYAVIPLRENKFSSKFWTKNFRITSDVPLDYETRREIHYHRGRATNQRAKSRFLFKIASPTRHDILYLPLLIPMYIIGKYLRNKSEYKLYAREKAHEYLWSVKPHLFTAKVSTSKNEFSNLLRNSNKNIPLLNANDKLRRNTREQNLCVVFCIKLLPNTECKSQNSCKYR